MKRPTLSSAYFVAVILVALSAGCSLERDSNDIETYFSRGPMVGELSGCRTLQAQPIGASVIKCCYAATGMYMTAAAAILRELASVSTSLSDDTRLRRDTKMSRRVSRRVASPACIAGVRVSRPHFSAPWGRTKL